MKAIISAIGHYVPEKRLTNQDLEAMVETNDDWITTRTGIKERRILGDNKGSSYMAVRAAKKVLEMRGISPDDIDLLIVATVTPDMMFPATACMIQKKLGAGGFAFDVTAACAGFVYGINMASLLIDSGQCRNVLVVGTELMSRVIDWKDRNTCILFGDAAGAVVMSRSPDPERGVLNSILQSDGTFSDILYLPSAADTGEPAHLRMEGKAVFKLAVQSLSDIVTASLEKEGASIDDLDYAFFHQANYRILNAVARRLKLPMDKVIMNGHRFGNTSSASIPLVLHEAEQDGKLKSGQLVVLAAIGGGMSWGCNLIRW